ncbi:MAG TPA: ATP-binding protein [Steroidobacteraceae bacterium]|nr:ATP-binding protein [Steroidobacteraceae bacterium]
MRATTRPLSSVRAAATRSRPRGLPALASGMRASAHSNAQRAEAATARVLANDPCLDHLLLEWYGNENGDAIVIISHAGTVAHANDRFRSLWSVEPQARLTVEADVWNAVLRLVDEPQTVQDMITAFGLDSVAAAKWTWKLTNGQQVECRTAPLNDDGGPRESRIWSFRELDTSEPTDDQTLHAQRLEAIGTVVCQLTHEIKNALAPIMGAVELAQLALPGEHRVHNHLGQIARATARAGDLAQKILGFGQNGTRPREQLDLGAAVRDTLDLLSAALPRNIKLQTRLEPVPPIFADAREIQQILMNLCINAWQAISPAPGTITISVSEDRVEAQDMDSSSEIAPGTYVRLSVRDSGCGMDDDTLQRIFQPFFTTKSSETGTGLGLPVVRAIADSHGATISVDSAPGRGTAFHVCFRAA